MPIRYLGEAHVWSGALWGNLLAVPVFDLAKPSSRESRDFLACITCCGTLETVGETFMVESRGNSKEKFLSMISGDIR